MSAAVRIEHISKVYRLGAIGSGTLQQDLASWWAHLRRRLDPVEMAAQSRHARKVGDQYWALDDVSFDVREGDVIGLIGRNGAGKSTLLKILSQVTAPTRGRITLRGRVASLLEVGTGFHPELTGRENVFLNGAILGMTKAEIKSRFDEIVAFSECETFIDTPVKRYSSGMYVRLAFAVAAHLEPEILIVDEVLAVGDVQFQKKCLGKMRDVSEHGRTILFVSHSMAAVAALCKRAILFHDGRLVKDGPVTDVVTEYLAQQPGAGQQNVTVAEMKRDGTGRARFVSLQVSAIDRDGNAIRLARPGCNVHLEMDIECHTDFSDANVAAIIYDENGVRVVDVNSALRGQFLSMKRGGTVTVRFLMTDVLLKPGTYSVGLWLGRGAVETIDHVDNAGSVWFHEDPAETKHTETFPGLYQCRFTHSFEVRSPALAV